MKPSRRARIWTILAALLLAFALLFALQVPSGEESDTDYGISATGGDEEAAAADPDSIAEADDSQSELEPEPREPITGQRLAYRLKIEGDAFSVVSSGAVEGDFGAPRPARLVPGSWLCQLRDGAGEVLDEMVISDPLRVCELMSQGAELTSTSELVQLRFAATETDEPATLSIQRIQSVGLRPQLELLTTVEL